MTTTTLSPIERCGESCFPVLGSVKATNLEFTNAFLDPESEEYKALEDDVRRALIATISEDPTIGSNLFDIQITDIREGSVIVDYIVVVESYVRPGQIKKCINDVAQANDSFIGAYRIQETATISTGDDYLILSRGIPSSKLTSSSNYDTTMAAFRGRLFNVGDGENFGHWSASSLNTDQYIQVDLGTNCTVTAIATQGRHGSDEWVTSYRVEYSLDLVTFITYSDLDGDVPKSFLGNTDRDTVVVNKLVRPFVASAVRVNPRTWSGRISMRFDVIGSSTAQAPSSTLTYSESSLGEFQTTSSNVTITSK
ncbi:unnamed protein product [Owenia fusiformis]|uniref:Uncharacterized protein n=1 Tax=Owenia fusiformis TaxID=6347 RepID=A0A8J1U5Z9_OWEFU|nr:unnamed protein product [Owenia fusiformis]